MVVVLDVVASALVGGNVDVEGEGGVLDWAVGKRSKSNQPSTTPPSPRPGKSKCNRARTNTSLRTRMGTTPRNHDSLRKQDKLRSPLQPACSSNDEGINSRICRVLTKKRTPDAENCPIFTLQTWSKTNTQHSFCMLEYILCFDVQKATNHVNNT